MTSRPATVLVVDDEEEMAQGVALVLEGARHAAIVETRSLAAMERVERERPDLVIVDLRMPDLDGLTLMQRIRAAHPGLPVVVLTGHASIDSAVEAMRKGATDYLAKPFQPDELLLRVERALTLARLTEEHRYLKTSAEAAGPYGVPVGGSRAWADVMRLVDKVAATDARVLITGESGTGKEMVARTIHRHGPRRDAPFFAINTGALTESLLESELFGHERGAFTGAVAAKRGLFEVAEAGTLFLDEIGETSPAFQTKLLRVVQEGELVRVGGTRAIKVGARLLAATNQDLRRAIAAGRFREDLFYRLSVVQIEVPPLRDRRDDIPVLAAHFLARHAPRLGKQVRGLHPEAADALLRHAWPGNIRELENVIERGLILAENGGEILPEHLPGDLFDDEPLPAAGVLDGRLRDTERDVLMEALRASGFNRTLAARRLGIGRRTLYEKLARLGISLTSPP